MRRKAKDAAHIAPYVSIYIGERRAEPSISRPARMRGEIEGSIVVRIQRHMCQNYSPTCRSVPEGRAQAKNGNSRFEYFYILIVKKNRRLRVPRARRICVNFIFSAICVEFFIPQKNDRDTAERIF